MTPEEKEEILNELGNRMEARLLKAINESSEAVLLAIPKIVSKVILEASSGKEMVKQFYKDNPEMLKDKDIVESVLQEVEGKNPGKQYTKIIEEARPLIAERIKKISSMDMNRPSRPTDMTFKDDVGTL
jgi:hypothetical protein